MSLENPSDHTSSPDNHHLSAQVAGLPPIPPGEPLSEQSVRDYFDKPDSRLSDLEARLRVRDTHDNNGRFWRGVGLMVAAGGVTGAIIAGSQTDGKITRDLPFSETAQEVVENVSPALAWAGGILVPASLGAIGAVKIGSRYSARLRAADKTSSKELTDDGNENVGPVRRRFRDTLRKYVAGTVPVVATGAVALGGAMTAVGEEISTGPNRPVVKMFDAMPGEGPYSVIAQDDTANPMLQSNLTRPLVSRVMQEARQHGIAASPVDLFLPTITYDGHSYTSLVLAFPNEPGSVLAPNGNAVDCSNVPVKVDAAAGIPVGARLEINGTPATAVEELKNTSAINRYGIIMEREAVATCLNKNPQAPDTMVLLETDKADAEQLLAEANKGLNETAEVMSQQEYFDSNTGFWESNSKPITNTLALMSMALAYVSMDHITYARMLRNRREWATKLAQGVGDTQMRLTELLRATKDGVAASAVGVGLATAIAPLTNFLEAGLRVGVDFKSAMVGCAVGILGSVGGTLHRVLRPRKTINVAEDTRM